MKAVAPVALTWSLLAGALLSVVAPSPALAVYQCGNQKDDCQCGSNNPYPCCDNGSNCTWWAWESACCNWKAALPGWGNANTWGSNAGKNPNYQVLGDPVPGSIATSTKGTYGHVAWVTGVNGSKVTVTEMNCCGGCAYGMKGNTFDKSYFNSGFVVKKGGGPPPGPVCGDGQCNGGENCGSCSKDCGGCCGNGKCDNGENCGSCSKDCGGCCGNGQCDNGENACSCQKDCSGPCCGDGQCNGGETCSGCAKDCGSCCGNGKCDNGENCSTCQKDCGGCCGNGACDFGETCKSCNADCKCPAEGALDGATCKAVWGWASDPDSIEKVSVKLRVGGEILEGGSASGDHPTHPGAGFTFAVPAALKNGKPQDVTVDAIDTQTGKATVLGPKAFLCENRQQLLGMWTTTFVDAAGVQPALPTVTPADLALAHSVPAGFAFPLSGSVLSCATPGLQAFDGGVATLAWQLGQHRAALQVDGAEVATWQNGAAQGLEVPFGPGQTLCLQTLALAQVPSLGSAHVTVGPIAFRRGPWTWSYKTPTAGLALGFGPLDAVQVKVRPAPFAVADGDVAWARLKLAQPFQRVTWTAVGVLPAGLAVAVWAGDKAFAVSGGTGQADVDGATAVEVRATASAGVAADLDVTVRDLRLRRTGQALVQPWRVTEDGAWGLAASLPSAKVGGAVPVDRGRSLRLQHAFAGWWTTGSVRAELQPVPYPIERIAARVHSTLPAGLTWRLTLDGGATGDGLVTVAQGTGGTERTVDLDQGVGGGEAGGGGHTLGATLAATQDLEAGSPGAVEVRGLRWAARGWWTAYDPTTLGLHDDRLGAGTPADLRDDGVRLHLAAAPDLASAKPHGTVVVARAFAGGQTGVRVHIRQDLHPGRVRASLLLDGAPVRLFDAAGAHEEKVEIAGISFREVGFALQVIDADPAAGAAAGPVPWWLEATAIEVRGTDGVWRLGSTVAAPASLSSVAGAADAGSVDAGPLDAKAPPVGSAATPAPSGCTSGPGNRPGATALLALLAALGVLCWRRTLLRSAPCRCSPPAT